MSTRGGTGRGRARAWSNNASQSSRGAVTTRGRGSGNQRGSVTLRGALHQTPRGNATSRGGGRGAQTAPPVNGTGVAAARGSWQDRYHELTKARENERAIAIANGILAHPDKRRTLAEAVTPVGTCMDMCPEYERAERVVQRDVWTEERDPNCSVYGAADQEPDEARMVKKFHRPDAGAQEQLPSDLRPPVVLKRTIDFLFDDVLANATSLAKVHGFIWDRTRGIRNDFSIQQVTKPEDVQFAIDCYERIVRFHILSLHQLSVEPPVSDKFSPFQEREQLDATLLSLMSFYDENRGRVSLHNEGEFRAYFTLFHLQDPDVEDRAQSWPASVLRDTRVQEALRLYAAACNTMDQHGPLSPFATQPIAQQDWQRFWTLVGSKRVSYLMACTAEIYFNLIRRTVLNAIWRGFRARMTVSPESFTIEYLGELFCLDSDDEVYRFCDFYGFSFKDGANGNRCLDLTSVAGASLAIPKGEVKQIKSNLVEDKRFGRTLPAIISGMTVVQAQDAGLALIEEVEEAMEDAIEVEPLEAATNDLDPATNEPVDDGESLFIPDTSKPVFTTGIQLARPFATEKQASNPFAPTNGLHKEQTPNTSPFAGFGGFGKPSTGVGAAPSDIAPSSIIPGFSRTTEKTEAVSDKNLQVGSTAACFDINRIPSETPTGLEGSLFSFATTPANGTQIAPSPFFTTSKTDANNAFAAPSATKLQTEMKATEDQESVFAKSSFSSAKPFFNWGATANKSVDLSSSTNAPATPPSSLATATAPSFLSHTTAPSSVTSAAPAALNEASGCEAKPTQTQSTSLASSTATPSTVLPHNAQPAQVEQPSRRSSLSNFQPRKPSPLSNSFGPEETEHSAVGRGKGANHASTNFSFPKSLPAPQQDLILTKPSILNKDTAAAEQENVLSRLAEEFTVQLDVGYLQQFIEFTVGQVITEVQETLYFERVNAEADDFRWSVLAHRYSKKWRDLAWRKRQADKGRARRQRAQRALRESKTPSEMGSTLSSIRGSVVGAGSGYIMSRREEVDAMFKQTVRNGGSPEQQAASSSKRPSSSHEATTVERQSGHKRLKSANHVDGDGRVSKPASTNLPHADLLQRSSFLGFSLRGASLKRGSTTKTNYFRLKALGIPSAPPQTVPRGIKRQRGASINDAATAQSLSKRSSLNTPRETGAVQHQAATRRSSATADADEDDVMFARLRAVRAELQDSTTFMKSEVSQDEELRRSTGSRNAHESPSMARARAEARERVSPNNTTADSRQDVPAYRLRESRFVPREQYAKAIERSRDFRVSRSREVSRPGSRLGEDTFDLSPYGVSAQGHPAPSYRQRENQASVLNDTQISQPLKLNGTSGVAWPAGSASPLHEVPNGLPLGPSSSFGGFAGLSAIQAHSQARGDFGNSTNQAAQPSFGYQSMESTSFGSVDLTVKPPQIDETLVRSFGLSQTSQQPPSGQTPQAPFTTAPLHQQYNGFEQSSSFFQTQPSAPFVQSQPSAVPSQQQYVYPQVASQAIALLSNEDKENPRHRNSLHETETNGGPFVRGDTEEDFTDDGTEEDELNDQSRYRTNNPYDLLARDDDLDNEGDEEEEIDEDEGGDGASERGYDTDADLEDGYDEDEEGNSDELSEDELAEPTHPPLRSYAPRRYMGRPAGWQPEPTPPRNETLMAVGGTVDEAIELSD